MKKHLSRFLKFASFLKESSTLETGKLVIGTYFTNPPFEFLNKGKEVGFEIDLMKAICKKLQLKCDFVDTTWEGILGRLERNRYDVIIGGITITKERLLTLNFSKPYMVTTLSVVVNKKRSPEIMRLDHLKRKTIGVQAETTDQDIAQKMLLEEKIGRIMIYSFNNIDEALVDLKKGVIDAVIKVFPVANYLVHSDKDLKMIAQVPRDPQPLGFGFNKKNTSLLRKMNQALTSLKRDGTYKAIYHKWIKS